MKIAKMFAKDCDIPLSASALDAVMRSMRTTTLFGGLEPIDTLTDFIKQEAEKIPPMPSPARGAER